VRKKLTNELINSYTQLDDHSRAVLRGFAQTFPNSTIRWLSRHEVAHREEERSVSASESRCAVSVKDHQPIKTAAPVPLKQMRLF